MVKALDIYKNKKVLITGDTGFKGSWLASWLLSLEAKVFGYALAPKTNKDNYVICNLENKYETLNADIRNFESLANYVAKIQPEFIFHLAAQPLVLDSYKDPVETFSTNVMGTLNILEIARKTPSIKSIVNVTTDKCYDNKEWIYGYREIDPLGGKDPYSASKACSELITSSYNSSFFSKSNNTNLASARAGNIIGGGDWSENRIVPDCIKFILENKDIVLRNPSSVRPWQYVLEPLYGYLLLGSLLYTEGQKYASAWNFGPNQKKLFSVEELVKEFISNWGSGSYLVEEVSKKVLESGILYLDIAKALNILKWKPLLTFSETVKITVDDYKDELDNSNIFEKRLARIKKYQELIDKEE